jgi:hypothetical protein
MTNRLTGVAWAVVGLTLAAWITAFAMPLPDPSISLWDALVWAVPYMVFPMVGAAIIRHQPANRVGWLLSGIGLIQGLGVVTNSLLHQLYSQPGWHAYVPWLVLTQPLALFSAFFIALLLVTFPDGHLPSTRWRWLVVGLALALAKVAVGQVVSPVSQSPGVPPSALANAALARLLDPVNSFDLNGLFFLAAASARVPLSSRARGRPGAGQVVLPGSGRVDRVHDRGRRGGRDLPPQRRPGLPAVGRFPGPGCGHRDRGRAPSAL